MTPGELKIESYQDAESLIGELKKQLEAGEILSVLVVSERTDGTLQGGCTATENVYALFGYVLCWAMMRMGFVREHK